MKIIGTGAFEWCPALTSVTLPPSIEWVKREAFDTGGMKIGVKRKKPKFFPVGRWDKAWVGKGVKVKWNVK